MTREEFDAAARGLPGATMDVQRGGDCIDKVAGKLTRKQRAEIGLA